MIRIAEDRRHSRDNEAWRYHKTEAYDDAIQPKYESKYGDADAEKIDAAHGVNCKW